MYLEMFHAMFVNKNYSNQSAHSSCKFCLQAVFFIFGRPNKSQYSPEVGSIKAQVGPLNPSKAQ